MLAACADSLELVAKPAEVPAGVDLSGQWLLRDTAGTTQRRAREALVYTFVETGSSVKITQTESALFVSFDRSVVEEYRFREHRFVNVGPIEADRASGWVEGKYVIQTQDQEGALLEESYALEPGGDALVRTVSIDYDNEKPLSLRQVYDRVE